MSDLSVPGVCTPDAPLHLPELPVKFAPPNGPLFTLRLDRQTYDALHDWLRKKLQFADPARVDADTAASFCVFAAEWWRRNHEQGAWKWEGIQAALGLERVSQDHLRDWTERGLRQLRRPLVKLEGNTRYLASLATEGGLPLKLVKRQGSYLHGLFSALFLHLDRTSNRAPTAEEVATLAEHRSHALPPSLRQAPVYLLTGQLVARLWPLILEVAGEEQPIAWLDAHHSRWRAELPVELDDGDARAFLERLVVAGTETLNREAGFELGCHLAQDPDTEAWRLVRSFGAPAEVPVEEAKSFLGDHADNPTIRVRMIGARAEAVAAVLRRHQDAFYAELTPGARIRDDDGAIEVELLSRVPASRASVVGSAPLGPLPWTFRRRRDRWELVATGSCRVADEVVWVALTPEMTVSPGEALTEVGDLERVGRRLVEVRGPVEVATPDGAVRIACGLREIDDAARFVWVGGRHPALDAHRPVFHGWPTLFEEGAKGIRRRVEPEVKTAAGWSPQGKVYGDVLTRRVTRDGRLLFVQWLQVVPRDLSVTLDVGDTQGTITVRSAHLKDAGAPSEGGVRVERAPITGGVVLTVRLTGTERPAYLELRLDFGGRPVTARVPSPLQVREMLGRDGKPVSAGRVLHVGELGGVRIQVTEPRQQRHYVEAALVGEGVKRTFSVPPSGDHSSTLDLRAIQDDVRALLAQSLDLDAEVELRLFTPGAAVGRGGRVKVRRYDWKPDLDKVHGDVVLPDAGNTDELVVEARPFRAILEKEQLSRLRSARLPGARWVFERPGRANGAWLITVRDGVWFRARPTLWTVPGAVPATGLSGALQVGEEQARRLAIGSALDAIATNLDHPDWILLDHLLEACADLPAATFDVVKELVGHRVLPLVLLRLTWRASDLRLRILEALGFLPVCWMTVPRDWWFAAFDCLRAAGDADRDGQGIEDVLAAVATFGSTMDLDSYAFLWCRERGLPAGADLGQMVRMAETPEGRALALETRADLVDGLVHRHLDELQWPTPPLPTPTTVLRVVHPFPHQHVDQIAQAPVLAVQHTFASQMPAASVARALKDAHDFDPLYFRECWSRTLAVALAQPRRTHVRNP